MSASASKRDPHPSASKPAAAKRAEQEPRRGGAPVGVPLAAGPAGTYFGAGVLSGDAASRFGSVFRVEASGDVSVLHDFSGDDGALPVGVPVLARDGYLYGATREGGAGGAGTLYRVLPDGTDFVVVHAFTGGADGGRPLAGLVEAYDRGLYGTASEGGVNGRGVVFRVGAGGVEVLHAFAAGEGEAPAAGLMDGGDGFLYGTTRGGGSGQGTVFALRTDGTAFATLHAFAGAEGSFPETELVRGSDGRLYGTTSLGGLWNNGTLYSVAPDGRFSREVAFKGSGRETSQTADRSRPQKLASGSDGALYGTTLSSVRARYGEVYRFDPRTGELTVLRALGASEDARAGLVAGPGGAVMVPSCGAGSEAKAAAVRLTPADGATPAAAAWAAAAVTPDIVATPAEKGAPAVVSCGTGNWTAAAVYPQTICRYAFAQSGEDLYLLGGVNNGTRVPNVRRYNAGTNVWTDLANAPFASEAPTAAILNGKIYLTEGDTGNHFGIYDIAGNSWTPGPNVPGLSNHYGSASGAFNGKVYVVGGSSAGSNTVQVYDVAGNSWSPGTNAPTGFFLAGYVQVGQFLYVVGGFPTGAGTTNNTVTMRLDMATGTWTTGPTFTPQRADFGLAFASNKLYAIGGDANGGSFFDSVVTVDELDVSAWPAGTWTSSAPNLPTPVRQANQAGYLQTTGRSGGEIWSTGGINGITFTFLNEHLYRGQLAAPTITGNPTNQTVCAGGTATFTASATGSPTPTVQWQVSTGGPFTDIPSATSTTLSFTAAAADNGKQYRAVFTNTCGSTPTTAATLTVNTAPVVTGNPSNQTNVCVGGTASFTASASGSPVPTVQWQVSTGGPFTDIPGAGSQTLQVTGVTTAFNGRQYRAVFTNACGSTPTTAATLTVDAIAPTVTCPGNISVPATGPSGAVVNYMTPSASDNCAIQSVVCSPSSGSTFPVGTTTVNCTATDTAGNTAPCSFSVTVGFPFDRCIRNGMTGDYFLAIFNPPPGSGALAGYFEYHRGNGTLVASGIGTIVYNLPYYQLLQAYGPSGLYLNASVSPGAGYADVQLFAPGGPYYLVDSNINDGGCP